MGFFEELFESEEDKNMRLERERQQEEARREKERRQEEARQERERREELARKRRERRERNEYLKDHPDEKFMEDLGDSIGSTIDKAYRLVESFVVGLFRDNSID